jgi:hypothetical protein
MTTPDFGDYLRAYDGQQEAAAAAAARQQQEQEAAQEHQRQLLGEFATNMLQAGIDPPAQFVVARCVEIPEQKRLLRDAIPATHRYDVTRRVPAWLVDISQVSHDGKWEQYDYYWYTFLTTDGIVTESTDRSSPYGEDRYAQHLANGTSDPLVRWSPQKIEPGEKLAHAYKLHANRDPNLQWHYDHYAQAVAGFLQNA